MEAHLASDASTSSPRNAPGTVPLWPFLLAGIASIIVAGAIELAMGRHPISQSGTIRLWVSESNGAETSQQIADWYSLSHISHGIILFGFFWLISRGKWPRGLCLMLAIFAESAWEILENSAFIINRYREMTAANGYYGDSVLNSVCDILFCSAGVLVAKYLPLRVTLAFLVVTEVGMAVAIHDNLTLNVLMLIHPFEGIKHWQMGAG